MNSTTPTMSSTTSSSTTSTPPSSTPDEERGYRLVVDRAVGLLRGDPVPPRSESPLRCRPSELQHRLDQWASAIAATLAPLTATYWIICRAYPVHPRSDHELPAECTLAIRPEAPSCLRSMVHHWRVVDPSVRECTHCGLRHEYHEQASPRPWENYGWSGDCDYDDDGGGTEVGDEIGYQDHIWRIVKTNKKDGLLTIVLPGTRRTRTLTLADIMQSSEEEVDEEERRCGIPTTLPLPAAAYAAPRVIG